VARLFGTDGIRGVANRDLTPELAMAVGRGLVATLGRGDAPYLIARDTRLSGEMLTSALVAGICAGGGDVDRAGILPTPAMAYLVRQLHRPCGVVLSASHNPIEDNGIKVFGPDGFKLPDEVEDRVEAAARAGGERPVGTAVGRAADFENAEELYLEHLTSLGLHPLAGLRLAVDCAYGAAYRVAPRMWRALGADVIPIHDEPDGARINVACGSTHLRPLVEAVRAHHADVGFAHDGDADRVIAVDERGEIVDGDLIMAIAARDLAAAGRLRGGLVVATVMSNLGLEHLLAAHTIRLERARVGDRYVLDRMQDLGASLGGEQSGHIIFLDEATTGDGLLTALHLADVMRRSGQPLSALAGGFQRFPQVLHNVVVGDRDRWEADRDVRAAIDAAQTRLADRGRLLVRASGTEPLVRVMVEARDAAEAEAVAAAVADVIAARYGTGRVAPAGTGGANG